MNILRSLAALFFPRRCHVCDEILAAHEQFICLNCLKTLPRTNFHRRSPNPMELKLIGNFNVVRASALFFYSQKSDVAKIVQDIKYRNFPEMGRFLGSLAFKELAPTGFFSDIDFICPIPIHFLKRMKRGYNQAQFIARGLAEDSHMILSNDLYAHKGHATQTSKTFEQRLVNTKNIFSLKNPRRYDDKHILIVDDVCTSGATVISAAQTIIQNVANPRISAFTLSCVKK